MDVKDLLERYREPEPDPASPFAGLPPMPDDPAPRPRRPYEELEDVDDCDEQEEGEYYRRVSTGNLLSAFIPFFLLIAFLMVWLITAIVTWPK